TIGARFGELTVEITTYRADAYDGVTRKPVVAFGDSLEGDLLRRDFTVNAMALRLPAKVLVDPSGGLDDLLTQRLRTPIEPEVSFGDDPLRILRGARFTSLARTRRPTRKHGPGVSTRRILEGYNLGDSRDWIRPGIGLSA